MPSAKRPSAKADDTKAKPRRASRSKSKSPSRQAPAKPRSRSASRSRQGAAPQQKQSKPSGRASTPTRRQQSRSASRDRTAAKASPKSSPKEPKPTRVSRRTKSANYTADDGETVTKRVETRMSKTETSTSTSSTRKSESSAKKASSSRSYEFGGPWGVSFLTIALPALLLYVNLQCSNRCSPTKFAIERPSMAALISWKSAALVSGWIAVQALLYCLPIGGGWATGLPLRPGGAKLQYRCNGLFAMIISLLGIAAVQYSRVLPLSRLVEAELIRMLVFSIGLSFVLSVLLFVKAFRIPAGRRSIQGNSGCWGYDFFMGRELNPRIGSFDLKFFFEMRPSLIGWAVIELLLCYRAHELKQLTPSLALVTALHLLYITASLYSERAILSTVDIKQEGLGFMLVFGNLAWVPFGFTITARYLFATASSLPWYCLMPIVALNGIGFVLFLAANAQKDAFRRQPTNPQLVGLRSLPTGISGCQLLADGLWGKLRHPNYTGDLLMALSWSLLAGFRSPMPWLYFIYLLQLLLHRCCRVEAYCRQKYGVAWERYVQLVPYRFIPRVY